MRKIGVVLVIALIVVLTVAIPFLVIAAGSVTEAVSWITGQNTKVMTLSWTGDASSGAVPSTVISPLNGYLLRVVTRPHTDSTIQPQDNYDLTLIEHLDGSLDLFGGLGANRDEANAEEFIPSHYNGTMNVYPVYSATPLMFTHANSSIGSATGQVIMTIEVPK